eukprot:Anaeramoba_flamelloidesc41925_g1_i1.p1 GENE.c41925_g1_i1~~c41925_g1_i1.p1  ORF type:complete len:233 (+),score=57.25 c41925_g1_i1:33-701(+)
MSDLDPKLQDLLTKIFLEINTSSTKKRKTLITKELIPELEKLQVLPSKAIPTLYTIIRLTLFQYTDRKSKLVIEQLITFLTKSKTDNEKAQFGTYFLQKLVQATEKFQNTSAKDNCNEKYTLLRWFCAVLKNLPKEIFSKFQTKQYNMIVKLFVDLSSFLLGMKKSFSKCGKKKIIETIRTIGEGSKLLDSLLLISKEEPKEKEKKKKSHFTGIHFFLFLSC